MLIVIEGVDGSGKQTHSDLLLHKLTKKVNVKKISFPDYESNSSALVKMYLSGEFGENASEINPYVASSFYAVDRVASYLKSWKHDLDNNCVIIADRYTTSNAIHQASKLDGKEIDRFLTWLFDFEYNLLGLPKPDLVVFLNMPPKHSKALIENRDNKFSGDSNLDIHERDFTYLERSYNNAIDVANKYDWSIINCVKDNKVRSIEEINDEVLNLIMQKLGDN